MTDVVAKLRRHRVLGVQLLMDFRQATPETAAGLVERANAWERDLIPLVEPFGHGAAAPFKPLTPMHLHEQLTVAGCAPLDDGFNLARIEHAVRIFRLGELFNQIPPVLSKRAGRKKGEKTYSDSAAKAEARRLQALPNPPSLRKIAQIVEPLADRGQSEEANFARVYKWLRGL